MRSLGRRDQRATTCTLLSMFPPSSGRLGIAWQLLLELLLEAVVQQSRETVAAWAARSAADRSDINRVHSNRHQ